MASVLDDGLELGLGKEAIDLGYFGDLFDLSQLRYLFTREQTGALLVLLSVIVGRLNAKKGLLHHGGQI